MANGKVIWLCERHQSSIKVTELSSEKAEIESSEKVGNDGMTMINGLRVGSSNTNLPGTTGFASNMAKRDPAKKETEKESGLQLILPSAMQIERNKRKKESKDAETEDVQNALKTEIEIAQEVGKFLERSMIPARASPSGVPGLGARSKTFFGMESRKEVQDTGFKRETKNAKPSPGPSRFAIAGRPTRTGMSHINYLTRSHYFPVPPRLKPVNSPAEFRSTPDWLRFIPVKPRQSPGCRRVCPEPRQRQGRAPVYRNSAGTHRGFTGIRPHQRYDNAPVKPRSSPDYAGIHRGVAVAKTRSALALVELRCHPVCSRCHAGRSRSLPETPDSPRSANDKKEFS
ncbi:hypothetical protein DPMN_141324 [Dreissena polymorpha]|uniref:Uncharacterized protein n=1 Tax=Dreissena polymorpha TaxID=45954 RepID=A0A9D4G966_DREPO|nr:hypothetical protein DPMN_141324 [Dreissena polymorpha]